jgi:hypothetical protein
MSKIKYYRLFENEKMEYHVTNGKLPTNAFEITEGTYNLMICPNIPKNKKTTEQAAFIYASDNVLECLLCIKCNVGDFIRENQRDPDHTPPII